MKQKILAVALEELREDLSDNDGVFETDRLQEILIEQDLEAQYSYYETEIENAIGVVSALESIYDAVLGCSDDGRQRVNLDAVMEISNTLVKSSGMPEIVSVATENWTTGNRKQKKQIALEGLGSLIKKVWNAIIDFLKRIWNWIKNLFSWQKKKEARLKAEAEAAKSNTKTAQEHRRDYLAGLARAEKEHLKQFKQKDIDDAIAAAIARISTDDPNLAKHSTRSKDKRNSRLNKNIVTTERRQVSNVIVTSYYIHDKPKAATESINADGSSSYLVDSVISILDEIKGLKPCYQSFKSKYLLLSEQYRNSNVYTVQDVQKNLTRFLSTAKGVMKYLEEVQMVYLKKAINVLTASTFDAKQATDVLLHVYPDTSELAKYLPYSKAGDKNVFMDTFPGFEKVEAFCLFNSDALFEAIEAGFGVGKYMDQVKLFKSSISDINDPALIEMSFDETALNAMSDTSYKTFELFQDLSSFSSRYEQVSKGLTKAAERAAKNADDNENKQASAFARMVMHATNVQVNQYLTLLNSIVPEVIEASCDYVRCSMICTNPEAAVSLL